MKKPRSLVKRNGRKKDIERYYLEAFLRIANEDFTVTDHEEPDFVCHKGSKIVGFEITELHRDTRSKGSSTRELESRRNAYLAELDSCYTTKFGKPLSAQITFAKNLVPGKETISRITENIITRRPPQDFFQCRYQEPAIGIICLRSLPANSLNNWVCVNNSVGQIANISRQSLNELIFKKAKKLPKYRVSAADVRLVIVANKTRNSGMLRLAPEFKALPSHGFDQIHLFIYPDSIYEISKRSTFFRKILKEFHCFIPQLFK